MLMQPRDNRLHIIRHVTWVGFWINAMLMALKLAFGFYGHSDALIADGFHSLSDFGTDFIVLVLVGIAHKGADNDHPYGHGKFETIASVIISLILICVAAGINHLGYQKHRRFRLRRASVAARYLDACGSGSVDSCQGMALPLYHDQRPGSGIGSA